MLYKIMQRGDRYFIPYEQDGDFLKGVSIDMSGGTMNAIIVSGHIRMYEEVSSPTPQLQQLRDAIRSKVDASRDTLDDELEVLLLNYNAPGESKNPDVLPGLHSLRL